MAKQHRRRPAPPQARLPSEPLWSNGLPRITPISDISDADGLRGLRYGVAVPGTGEVVAAFADEKLAKQFAVTLGAGYAQRAEALFVREDKSRMDPNERQYFKSLREA